MTDGIVGVMKRVAEHEARRILTTELGVVTAIFPHADEGDTDNYQCSVKLRGRVLPDGQEMELRRVPVAVPYLGLAAIPSVGDLVLVSFVGGDANAPVITGRLYDDETRPPPNKADEFLLRQKPKEGPAFLMDAEGKIVLTSKDEKKTVTLSDEKISLESEKFSLVIDFSGEKIVITSGGDLELAAKGKCVIDAAELQIKSSGAATIEAGGAMTVKGATIDMN